MIGEEVDQYKRMNDLATPTAVIATRSKVSNQV